MPLWAERKTGSRATKWLCVQQGAVPIPAPQSKSAAAPKRENREWEDFDALPRFMKIAVSKSGSANNIVATAVAASPIRAPTTNDRLAPGPSGLLVIQAITHQ